MFVLALPLQSGSSVLTIVAFVGGLSAATAMVIVESVALSIMVSNDIVMPLVLRRRGALIAGREQCRLAAADGAAGGDLRHHAARLSLLPLGGRRAARLDRPALLRRGRATGAGVFRRPVLAPRHRRRRHRRHDRGIRGLGLHAAAAELRRRRHRRPAHPHRRALAHRRAAAAAFVRARPVAAGAWRALEPGDQFHLLHRLLAAARALADRAAAGQRCSCRPIWRRSRRASGSGAPR